jgi:hypothetical protein
MSWLLKYDVNFSLFNHIKLKIHRMNTCEHYKNENNSKIQYHKRQSLFVVTYIFKNASRGQNKSQSSKKQHEISHVSKEKQTSLEN